MKTFRHNLQKEIDQFGALTDRTLAGLRVILAAGALFIIYVDPTEPDRYVLPTYWTLIAYTLYSLTIYALARRRTNFSQRALRALVWADIAIYTVLIALSTGTNSLFSFFYLFAIIVASSRGGMKLGLAATVASTLLFFAVDFVSAMQEPFELHRFLIRRLAMSSLGYVLAFWGGAELALKRRLALLRDLSVVANPRFGTDRTIEQMLRRLVNLYDGDYGLLVLRSEDGFELYRVTPDTPEGACRPEHVDRGAPISLIDSSDSLATVYARRERLWSRQPIYQGYITEPSAAIVQPVHEGQAIAEFFDARTFVSVPVQYRDQLRGRLIIASRRRHNFELQDAVFLVQVVSQVFPVVDNMRLVDRMAWDASEEERRKIARTVHDRVIQPYYGLQVGLKALRDLIEPASAGLNGKVKQVALLDQLMAMTTDGIEELRQYIYCLKQSPADDVHLLDSIRRFAHKFEVATGIQVKVVDGCGRFTANQPLTADVFQMTAEALSNVHRHTTARSAEVAVKLEGCNLILLVENEVDDTAAPASFSPRSICERAAALGGRTEVSSDAGRTVVRVEVPL